jgi:hypothetical protein
MMQEPKSDFRLIAFSEDAIDFGFSDAMTESP